MGMPNTVTQIATATLRNSFRDNTVLLLTAIFLAMVLLSAWLGWSATQTINAIYAAATKALAAKGVSIPPNPVSEGSALSLLRNMSIYIALLGSLAALVFGHLSIAADRKSGIIPLIATRPLSRDTLAAGKIGAIVSAIFGLTVFAAIVNVITLLILPGLTLTSDTWIRLIGFYGASMLYMLAFALLAGVCALRFRTESMALLVPVAIWLILTFVLPQVTANISPMAALNPLSATAALPTGPFFVATDTFLGPLSLAEAYRSLSAELLQLSPDNLPRRSITQSLATMIFVNAVLAVILVLSMRRFDVSRSDFND
jgi:ABC-type transport system involved in multi-copper enzyme maturation permease subunit